MKEFELKYGCNPNQKPASIFMADGSDLPITILNGRPGYINFLDAFNSWQLVCELKAATGLPAAASFKHVSPAGAAIGLPLTPEMKRACFVEDIEGLDESPLACAYARARGSDRMCSFGDWIALSDVCDKTTAAIIRREVSDGVIAPGYTDEAMELLLQKKRGEYNIVVMDPSYVPAPEETKQVFGITFRQGRNSIPIGKELLGNIVSREKNLPESAARDLLVALITLKYTQSNSVCYVYDGQAVGVGAGQQSRIHCTRLAGDKADKWFLRQSERVQTLPFRPELGRAERDNAIDVFLSDDYEDVIGDDVWAESFTEQPAPFPRAERQAWLKEHISGVSLGSDAFFPFGDNVIRAHRSGVTYIAQPGGSKRDSLVIEACDACGMVMAFTGLRLFHH